MIHRIYVSGANPFKKLHSLEDLIERLL